MTVEPPHVLRSRSLDERALSRTTIGISIKLTPRQATSRISQYRGPRLQSLIIDRLTRRLTDRLFLSDNSPFPGLTTQSRHRDSAGNNAPATRDSSFDSSHPTTARFQPRHSRSSRYRARLQSLIIDRLTRRLTDRLFLSDRDPSQASPSRRHGIAARLVITLPPSGTHLSTRPIRQQHVSSLPTPDRLDTGPVFKASSSTDLPEGSPTDSSYPTATRLKPHRLAILASRLGW